MQIDLEPREQQKRREPIFNRMGPVGAMNAFVLLVTSAVGWGLWSLKPYDFWFWTACGVTLAIAGILAVMLSRK